MKRIITMLLALVMVFGLVACGSETTPETTKAPAANNEETSGNAGTSETEELEHMDITISWWDGESLLPNDKIQQLVEEKFNVTFEVMNVTWDDYEQKYQLWAATDSLPDVFAADFRNSATFGTWARDGVIRSLPDLSNYPNLQNYMQGAAAENCKVDGDFYCIFRQNYAEQAETVRDRIIVYRWDLAQAAGITEEPTNWEEFCAMIKAIEAADPEGKKIGGLTAPGASYLTYILMSYSNPNAIVEGAVFKWEKAADGTYIPAYFNGETLGANSLPAWNLMRQMYQDGIIDQDIALANLEQSKNQFLSGQFAALCITETQLWDLDGNWKELNGCEFEESIKFLNLMPGVDGNTYYWPSDYAWSESMFSANVDDEKMDRLMMIYDYLLSDEGVMLCKYGYEGETYEVVDGKLQFIDGKAPKETYPSLDVFGNLVAWKPTLPNGWTDPNVYDDWYNEGVANYIDQARECTLPTTYAECITAFLALESEFGTHVNDDLLLIMTGDEPVETIWNRIIEEYKADGLMEVIEAVNDALN